MLIRYLFFLSLIIFINGCSGNQALQSLFAPNPQLQNNNTPSTNPPENSASTVKLPENFPKTIPVYSQAKLVSVDGNQTLWTSIDPLNLIIEYYQQELTAKKWTINQREENLIVATNPETQESLKISLTPRNGETEFTLNYGESGNQVINTNPNGNNTSNNQNNSTSNNNPLTTPNNTPPNPSSLAELARLQIIPENLDPYKPITRREYARWLFKVNNLLYANSNGKLIRPANPNSKPVFNDIPQNDPDFVIIQGLAEAGLLPSILTQDSKSIVFKPSAFLTREDLISWKIPLDFRQKLPNTTLDNIKETWGFQDANKINPQTWQELYVDWQNGDDSNIRRAFGYITLFQPQKVVTYEEAGRVLSSFGYQGDIMRIQDVTLNTSNPP